MIFPKVIRVVSGRLRTRIQVSFPVACTTRPYCLSQIRISGFFQKFNTNRRKTSIHHIYHQLRASCPRWPWCQESRCRLGPNVWFKWWKVLTAELRCLWIVRLHLLDRNGGRTKCASKLLSLVIDLLMASKNVAFELSVNLPTVGTSDESKCEP